MASSTRLSGGITYMVDDNIALDLPVAIPFEHDISGDGAILGVGNWHGRALRRPWLRSGAFRAHRHVRPYVGAGLTYAAFFGARSTSTLTAISGGTPSNPTTLSVESKWAATVQLGATAQLGGGWFLDANYTYTPLSTRTTLSTGQTLDAKLDPSSFSLAVGMKF
jgi:outer membrane protein